jgi:hypothetical protein
MSRKLRRSRRWAEPVLVPDELVNAGQFHWLINHRTETGLPGGRAQDADEVEGKAQRCLAVAAY